MCKKIFLTRIFLLGLCIVALLSSTAISVFAFAPKGDVNLTLKVDRRLSAGSGKDIDGTYYISADSTFSQSYTVTNHTSSNSTLDIVLQERVLAESGAVITDWINLPASIQKDASVTLNGTNLVMTSAYGKKVTFQYRLRYKGTMGWQEYSSHTADIFVYSPTFNASYITDASPVALSDFPIYFGGKITLSSNAKVADVALYDSVHGLIESIGELTPGTTKRFQKDFYLPPGDVNSYLIVEYTDLLTGKKVRTELNDVHISGKIVAASVEPKLSLSALPAKTFIPSDETVEIIFEIKNDLSYDILSSYVYLLDENNRASAEPIFDFGPVARGQSLSVKKNIALQPNTQYSYAVYVYVPNTTIPFKAEYTFVTTSAPPSLTVTRSIEGDRLPFYQDTAINYTVKNISSKDVSDVVIIDGILGEIYQSHSIKAGDEVRFSATHKFTADFISNPIVTLTIQDAQQTKSTFMIERQTFEVMKKDQPSIMLLLENILAKDRKNVIFDVILANDGNMNFQKIDIVDVRNNTVVHTLSSLNVGEVQSIYITNQNYENDKTIQLQAKATTADGEELIFDMEPVKLPTSFLITFLIVFISLIAIVLAAVVYYKKRSKHTKIE